MLHAFVDRYYYELLGLQGNLAEGNLNLGHLEEGYREQSLKWHPDQNPPCAEAWYMESETKLDMSRDCEDKAKELKMRHRALDKFNEISKA